MVMRTSVVVLIAIGVIFYAHSNAPLYLYQSATGGAGGSIDYPANGGVGGNATSMLAVNDHAAGWLSGKVNAIGGAGGNSPGATGGNGGNATAYIALASTLNGVNVGSIASAMGGAAGTGLSQGIAGTSNATASAAAVGSGVATANSIAVGTGGGAAIATSTSSGPSGQSVVASATSPVGSSGPASAMTQTSFGGAVSLPNAINPGQSFSAVNAFAAGPSMIAAGSMDAGGIGASLTYQQTANFVFNALGGGLFLIDPLSNFSLGTGFDSAALQILLNGSVFESQTFNNLASAEAFFTPSNLIDIQLGAGLNNIQLAFNETMSGGEGFGFNYGAAGVSATPLPASWTMMLMGLIGLGFITYQRRKNVSAALAAA
jgi:hypothetical protein